jgi:hypothetical protein
MPGSSKDRSADRKKRWAEQFRKSFNRTEACKTTGVNRSTLWRWLKEDQEFSESIWNIEEEALDIAECKLMELVRAGNFQAIKFLLRSKARARGYGDRLEIAQTVKNETIDVKRLELLLSDSCIRNALEKLAVESLEDTSDEIQDAGRNQRFELEWDR